MSELTLPADLRTRFERIVSDLDGFEDAEELSRFVLDEAATEIERDVGDGGMGGADDRIVEDRLKQLGYIE